MLSIQNLSLRHKRPIFSRLNLEISRGDFLHIKGSNGVGKTSFLRTLAGLVPEIYPGDVQGQILYKGESLLVENPIHKIPGICLTGPWAASRLFCRTLWEEVTYSPAASEEEAHYLLRYFGIDNLRESHPQKLSGGQQQLALLCAYLSCRPELILLDEPFAPLSPDKAELLTKLLICLHQEGRTIILVEHGLPGGLEGLVKKFDMTPFQIKDRAEGQDKSSEENWEEWAVESEQIPLLSIRDLKVKVHRDLTFTYEDFQLAPGEILHLKGSVGSGKSTLIRGLLGLNHCEGEVRFKGKDLHSFSFKERSRLMGVILQSPDSQFFCPSVEEEIAFSARHSKAEDKAYISSLHRIFNLDHILGQHPFSLSHGEKKKCQIAAALSLKPKILILDEPDAGLDNHSLCILSAFFRNYIKKGNSIILTSHKKEFLNHLRESAGFVRTYKLKDEYCEN